MRTKLPTLQIQGLANHHKRFSYLHLRFTGIGGISKLSLLKIETVRNRAIIRLDLLRNQRHDLAERSGLVRFGMLNSQLSIRSARFELSHCPQMLRLLT
jgi:hypothetical protein